MGPTQTALSNQATGVTDDLSALLKELMGPMMNFATTAQRNVSGGAQQAIGQFLQPFDQSDTVAAMQEGQQLSRTRALQGVAEQFGSQGLRMGTPLAVGSARTMEGLVPAQDQVLGNLLLQGYTARANALPGLLNAGTAANANMMDPFLRMALAGVVNPATGPSGLTQIGNLF